MNNSFASLHVPVVARAVDGVAVWNLPARAEEVHPLRRLGVLDADVLEQVAHEDLGE